VHEEEKIMRITTCAVVRDALFENIYRQGFQPAAGKREVPRKLLVVKTVPSLNSSSLKHDCTSLQITWVKVLRTCWLENSVKAPYFLL
jgi:hypothetical protein